MACPDTRTRWRSSSGRTRPCGLALALFENAVEHMHQGLCMFDPDGRIALCNRPLCRGHQLPRRQIRPGLTARELVELGQRGRATIRPTSRAEQLEQYLWANLDGERRRARHARARRARPTR